ncbi:MAG: ATP-dependent Clp protease ATP-binding subunit [Clostridia bacterium]|nr:ATP-dependent Clp protease ATP-binding subunit [Clostridia bacterium]
MFEKKFTEKAASVLRYGETLARQFSQSYLGSEHLLYGLLKEKNGISHRILIAGGLREDKLIEKIREVYGTPAGAYTGKVAFTPKAKQMIELSFIEAKEMGHNYIGTEHLLLALLSLEDSVAGRILSALKVNTEQMKNDIYDMVSNGMLPPKLGEKPKNTSYSHRFHGDTPILNSCAKDLTRLCYEGKIDPMIGRDEEVERMIQVLCRRTKNNPCLIGEPGVGKTAIVEGLAQRIVDRNIPNLLRNKRVLSLDISSVLAGTKYRGEFEERVKKALDEAKKSENIILFIDEIHNIVGAGAAEGAIDAANILKPSLSRGEIHMIGATTLEEYRKHIERDAALERRFQPIVVSEPTVEETIRILDGIKDKFETHHNVKITDEAMKCAAELSHRYLRDRYLPDKAIDLIDEAASGVRLRLHTLPENIVETEEKLKNILREKEEAIATQDYERAAQMREKEMAFQKRYQQELEDWKAKNANARQVVTGDHIAEIISKWTGIPLVRLHEDEQKKLLSLEEKLHEKIVGQHQAVTAVSKAIRRGKSGLCDPDKPVGSFLFLGPTGVGKTELSKAISELVYGSRDAMIRLDMSEYMEKHSVSKMIGSPPGYVGYSEGGQLSEKVRRHPYSVVLFDEIEKAHPDVFHLLLQILDEGILTDATGRKINFKNTLIIMTSNIGARYITEETTSVGFRENNETPEEIHRQISEKVKRELKKTFQPEFLNRLDEVIVFSRLSSEELEAIVKILLNNLKSRLEQRGYIVDFSPEVIRFLATNEEREKYGARPLKRAVRQQVEDFLAESILSGNLKVGEKVKIIYKNQKISMEKN